MNNQNLESRSYLLPIYLPIHMSNAPAVKAVKWIIGGTESWPPLTPIPASSDLRGDDNKTRPLTTSQFEQPLSDPANHPSMAPGKQVLQDHSINPSHFKEHPRTKANNHVTGSDVPACSSQRLPRGQKDQVARRIACRITHKKLGLATIVDESLVLKHIDGILEDCGGGPIYWEGFEALDVQSEIFEDEFNLQCPWSRSLNFAKVWVVFLPACQSGQNADAAAVG